MKTLRGNSDLISLHCQKPCWYLYFSIASHLYRILHDQLDIWASMLAQLSALISYLSLAGVPIQQLTLHVGAHYCSADCPPVLVHGNTMERLRVLCCMSTSFFILLSKVPRHFLVDICEKVRQRRLGLLLCLVQSLHNLHSTEQHNHNKSLVRKLTFITNSRQ